MLMLSVEEIALYFIYGVIFARSDRRFKSVDLFSTTPLKYLGTADLGRPKLSSLIFFYF
jgi:hypothetical protein